MKLLLYCCKAKPYLYRQDDDTFKLENKLVDEEISDYKKYYGLNNGKIVTECDFEVEEIDTMALSEHVYDDYYNDNIDRISKESCLTCEQMCEYLGTTWDSKGYAIHIKNLHIFGKPRELSDYLTRAKEIDTLYGSNWVCESIDKAPQNMMYAQDENQNKKYILISIKPQWLCKILNGEKTIEVRKKVLKEMLE